MQTTDIGPLFFTLAKVNPDAPWLHTATSFEVEAPFRVSASLIIRLPFRFGLIVGWWRKTGWDEETALMTALGGYGLDPYEDSLSDPDVRQVIRENIAASGLDPSEEWRIIEMLGVED